MEDKKSDLEKFNTWLVNNQDKSDTADYKQIYDAYIALREQVNLAEQDASRASQPRDGGLVGGSLQWLADSAAGMVRSVNDAAKGPEGMPKAEQFNPSGTLYGVKGTFLTNDPVGQRNIIRENYPDAQFRPYEVDGKEYTMASRKDPETGEVETGWINKPGLDVMDVLRFGTQAAAYMPAAKKAAAAKGPVGRIFRSFFGGAATDLAIQKAGQTAGSKQDTDYITPLIVGAVGAALEPLAPMAKQAWRNIFFRSGRTFDPSTGGLTELGRKKAVEAGLNPDDMSHAVMKEFARLSQDATLEPELAKRVAATTEFNIPASRGQLTGNQQALDYEERARSGIEGPEPRKVLTEFDERQQRAFSNANRDVQQQISGNVNSARDMRDAGSSIMGGVESRYATLSAGVDDAYKAARAADLQGSKFTSAREINSFVDAYLQKNEVLIDKDTNSLTPAALKAYNTVLDLVGANRRPGRNYGEPTLLDVDKARRKVSRFINMSASGEDKRAAVNVKNALDKWVDSSVERGLFNGDDEVIKLLQTARGLRAEVGKLFEPNGKYDTSGKIVEAILNGAETPEEAVNLIFGAARLGAKKNAAATINRLRNVLGQDSDAFGAIKEAAWIRMSRDKTGQALTGKKFKESMDQFLHENRTLYEELFSPKERALMGRYRDAIDAAQGGGVKDKAKASALEGAIRYVIRRIGQRESFTKGNVPKGTLYNFLARAPIDPLSASSGARRRGAERAVSPIPTPRPTAPLLPASGQAGTREYRGRRNDRR